MKLTRKLFPLLLVTASATIANASPWPTGFDDKVSSNWPEAVTDSVDANYDELVKIPVLENDTGVDLKLIAVNEWSTNQGKAWISADNEISYQQYGEARGDQLDEFWYAFEDRWGRRNSAKVIVSLKETATPPWPTATPDFAEARNGLRTTIRVLENDTGNVLRLSSSNEWTKNGGQTEILGTYIRYTPPIGFSGTDSFWYELTDAQGRTNSAKVEVQVTKNNEKSVVEFCGNTYETDGTKANTQLSSLSPASPVTYPSTAIPPTEVEGELATINGRRYYVETSGSEQHLYMEADGSTSQVSSVSSDLETYAVGQYKGVLYFVQAGRYLLAHDGNKLTELGDLLLDLGGGNFYISPYDPDADEDPELYVNTMRREEGSGDAFYFSISNKITPSDGRTPQERVTYLRISDDLDWRPIKIQEVIPFESSNFIRTENVRSLHYFNGLDYYVQTLTLSQLLDGSFTNTTSYSIKQSDNGYLVKIINADGDAIQQDRNRLFITTKADTAAYSSAPNKATLYVVDNFNDELIELATCE